MRPVSHILCGYNTDTRTLALPITLLALCPTAFTSSPEPPSKYSQMSLDFMSTLALATRLEVTNIIVPCMLSSITYLEYTSSNDVVKAYLVGLMSQV